MQPHFEKKLIEGPTCNAANIFGEDDLTMDQRQSVIMGTDNCGRSGQLPLMRQQARLKIDDLVRWCNHRIWGWGGHGLPDPTASQRKDLLRLANQAGFAEYRRNAKEVARLRYLLQCLDEEEKMQQAMYVNKHEAAEKRAEARRLREAFEAEERAEADKRFEVWKKARGK